MYTETKEQIEQMTKEFIIALQQVPVCSPIDELQQYKLVLSILNKEKQSIELATIKELVKQEEWRLLKIKL